MAFGDMGDRFSPRQRRAFRIAEMGAHPPACQGVQFVLRHAGLTQGFAVHLQAEGAAVDLRYPQIHQFYQRAVQLAFFQRNLGLNQSVIDFRAQFIVRLT